jgi:hypothetical protein
MKKTAKSAKPVAAEEISKRADRGENISRFFKGEGRIVHPIQRVNVDITAGMLRGLQAAVKPSGCHIASFTVARGRSSRG